MYWQICLGSGGHQQSAKVSAPPIAFGGWIQNIHPREWT
jgi:hypothetical protein